MHCLGEEIKYKVAKEKINHHRRQLIVCKFFSTTRNRGEHPVEIFSGDSFV